MINVGTPDRIIRIVLGLVLLAIPFLPMTASFFAAWGAWKFLVAAVGLVLIVTGSVRICPLYAILGINTCPVERR
nr:DUF2892 domain-containing protein [Mesorhizobium sp.]